MPEAKDPATETSAAAAEAPAAAAAEASAKKERKKNTYKLYNFTPDDGRKAPKGGGSYKSVSPAGAARKCANRWICPKDEFGKVRTFYLRQIGAPKEKAIYEFSARRVKLEKPKVYKRGDREISVNSKIELVDKN